MADYTDQVINNTEEYQFEDHSGSLVSTLEYLFGKSLIDLVHTEVPVVLVGQGIGSSLVEAAMEYAKAKNLKVLVYCPFANGYLQRHPEWNDYINNI
jgi:predicted GNAT family acetyltransferase